MTLAPAACIHSITRRLNNLNDEQLSQLLFALNSIEAGVEEYNTRLQRSQEINRCLKTQMSKLLDEDTSMQDLKLENQQMRSQINQLQSVLSVHQKLAVTPTSIFESEQQRLQLIARLEKVIREKWSNAKNS